MSPVIRYSSSVSIWLALCLLLVASMVFVGGYTRLSGSGLSITTWNPIHGTLPPIGATEWDEEFAAYKATPQYQKINKGMSLDEFKDIFWPEYFHRLMGRLVGIVFFIPFVIFALRGCFTRRFSWRLIGIFALGGAQGFIGWFMVKSGLVNNPHVSHLRLALHLSVAFTIFALLLWALLDVTTSTKEKVPPTKHKVQGIYLLWFALLCLQIVLGAFVSGLHAGLIYNTWPTMNGQWIPDGLITATPWYENLTLIQFNHRCTAIALAVFFVIWCYAYRRYIQQKKLTNACLAVASVLTIQFILGILTLMKAAPLHLASIHQMTALLLFATSVVLLYRLKHAYDH
jgi:heme a synthase